MNRAYSEPSQHLLGFSSQQGQQNHWRRFRIRLAFSKESKQKGNGSLRTWAGWGERGARGAEHERAQSSPMKGGVWEVKLLQQQLLQPWLLSYSCRQGCPESLREQQLGRWDLCEMTGRLIVTEGWDRVGKKKWDGWHSARLTGVL